MSALKEPTQMETYTFTLIVEGPDLQAEGMIDSLFEAGCDDSLVGSVDGVQYVEFDREAESLEQAVLSAVDDLESVEGVMVVRLADAGLISMADIAARTGRTRESVRLLISGERGPGGFPPPVTDPRSRYRLWRVVEVEQWFDTHLSGELTHTRDDHIRTIINAGLELRRHRPLVSTEPAADLQTLVGL